MEKTTARKKACLEKNVQETNALEVIAAKQDVKAVIVIAQHALLKAVDRAIIIAIHRTNPLYL